MAEAASPPPSASQHPATWKFGYPIYHPETVAAWRAWLAAHAADHRGVWLASWRSHTRRPVAPYEAVVEEALCVGWIDATVNVLDDDRVLQLMTPRKPRSPWAASNKRRVERLLAEGRMKPAGLRAVEVAKANGAWSAYDDVEALLEPEDLAAALAAQPRARAAWDGFPPSARKMMLWWLKSAVRPDTRSRRIAAIVSAAAEGRRAQG